MGLVRSLDATDSFFNGLLGQARSGEQCLPWSIVTIHFGKIPQDICEAILSGRMSIDILSRKAAMNHVDVGVTFRNTI